MVGGVDDCDWICTLLIHKATRRILSIEFKENVQVRNIREVNMPFVGRFID